MAGARARDALRLSVGALTVTALLVAAGAVGARVPPLRIAAIALVVMLAGSIPLNIGGTLLRPRPSLETIAAALGGFSSASDGTGDDSGAPKRERRGRRG